MNLQLAFALFVLIGLPNFAHRAAPGSAVEEELIRLESSRTEAVVNGDVTRLQEILSDDLVYTHSTAHVDDKTSFIRAIQSGELHYEAMNHGNVRARVYGDAAVLTGESRVTANSPRSNGRQSITIRFISVYAKKDGRWKQVAWQSTRLPEKPEDPHK